MEEARLPLGRGISLYTTAESRAGEDAMLLARFARASAQDVACDLGTGGGIIPLLWCKSDPPSHIDAVEREQSFAALCSRSVAYNRLEATVRVICADWNALDGILPARSYSLITCNPPYFPKDRSRQSPSLLRRAARQEDGPDTLPRLFAAAKRLLADSGRFCLCHRPERLTEVLCGMRDAGLVPRRLQWVQQTASAAPWLFLCEACKADGRGKAPSLRVLAPILTARGGTHTDVYQKLYEKG